MDNGNQSHKENDMRILEQSAAQQSIIDAADNIALRLRIIADELRALSNLAVTAWPAHPDEAEQLRRRAEELQRTAFRIN